jgi:hypothetical protein
MAEQQGALCGPPAIHVPAVQVALGSAAQPLAQVVVELPGSQPPGGKVLPPAPMPPPATVPPLPVAPAFAAEPVPPDVSPLPLLPPPVTPLALPPLPPLPAVVAPPEPPGRAPDPDCPLGPDAPPPVEPAAPPLLQPNAAMAAISGSSSARTFKSILGENKVSHKEVGKGPRFIFSFLERFSPLLELARAAPAASTTAQKLAQRIWSFPKPKKASAAPPPARRQATCRTISGNLAAFRRCRSLKSADQGSNRWNKLQISGSELRDGRICLRMG